MNDEPLLEAKELTISLELEKGIYQAVSQLSFKLYPGKALAIVGESGCGKSLTALALMGLLPSPPALPPRGELLYRGVDLLRLSERQMQSVRGGKIAMIFQDPSMALNPVYSIGNQLMEVVELHLGLFGEAAEERVVRALQEVGLPSPKSCFEAYPHQLSGGMRQRVMIAMALLCEPDILVADEPTTALDVTMQAQILELMVELQREKGLALLLITHDMGVVAEVADQVLVMYGGEGIEWGGVVDLFDKMAHPYTQALFGARPVLMEAGKKLATIPGQVPSLDRLPQGCKFHPRCPYVMEKCRKGRVDRFDCGHGHEVRCWLYEQTGVKE